MKNGYQILCCEHGARPTEEVFAVYRCYTYEVFVEGILQGIIARQLDSVVDEYAGEEWLLILDIQKADGRPETMKMINGILKARIEKSNPTILIGEYIPPPVLVDLPEDTVFITDKVTPVPRKEARKGER